MHKFYLELLKAYEDDNYHFATVVLPKQLKEYVEYLQKYEYERKIFYLRRQLTKYKERERRRKT